MVSLGANAFLSQPLSENVSGEKDRNLNIAIQRKYSRTVSPIVRAYVTTENVGSILKNPIAAAPLP
jgi:hypothetical protein